MALTKPAGVGLQLIGVVFFLIGIGVLNQSTIFGVIILAIGIWCLWLGRQPAKRK